MRSWRKAVLFGFVIWLVAFVVAFAAFPIRQASRPLFESIMPVVLAALAAPLALRYFRSVEARFVQEGLRLGMVWLLVNVAVDLPLMLSPSPMQMTPSEYAGDIGLTYLLFPIITTAVGAARALAADGEAGGSEA